MIIDFHAHTFPDKIAAAAIGKLQQSSHAAAFTDGTVSALKSSMQAAGVDISVVLPVATNPTKVSSINDISLQMTERDGLIYFGCIHPDMEMWHQELGRISAAGLKGIKIHPVYQDTDIDDIRFLRILSRAGELGLTVVMHSGADIGFPGVIRCAPKMVRNALRQVGNVRLILAHMGGWRNWDEAADCLADTSACIDTAFSLGCITPLTENDYPGEARNMLGADDFCRLVRAFGSKRVFFGTDTPWADQRHTIEQINALPLTEAEKADIFGLNARALLGL